MRVNPNSIWEVFFLTTDGSIRSRKFRSRQNAAQFVEQSQPPECILRVEINVYDGEVVPFRGARYKIYA